MNTANQRLMSFDMKYEDIDIQGGVPTQYPYYTDFNAINCSMAPDSLLFQPPEESYIHGKISR
jgi:hypothetical protein